MCAERCAALQVGIQEKSTFGQVFGKLGVRSAPMWLPALLNLLLVALGAALMFSHTAPPPAAEEPSGFSLLEHADLEE